MKTTNIQKAPRPQQDHGWHMPSPGKTLTTGPSKTLAVGCLYKCNCDPYSPWLIQGPLELQVPGLYNVYDSNCSIKLVAGDIFFVMAYMGCVEYELGWHVQSYQVIHKEYAGMINISWCQKGYDQTLMYSTFRQYKRLTQPARLISSNHDYPVGTQGAPK